MKKLVSMALGVALLAAGGLLAFPAATWAQDADDLQQAQIVNLLDELNQLHEQQALQAGEGGSSHAYIPPSSPNSVASNTIVPNAPQSFAPFSRLLSFGVSGSDVLALQQFLNSQGTLVAVSGAGSPGRETTYFGSLTRAALARWQAAHGLLTSGALDAATLQAMIAIHSSNSGVSTNIGTGTGSGSASASISTSTATSSFTGNLNIALAADNPGSGPFISGSTPAARIPVLSFTLTAGPTQAVNISELDFHKTGVISDNAISGGYLTMGTQVIAQFSSLNNSVMRFTNLSLSVAAGQTEEFSLAIDPSPNLTAGNTISFGLLSAADITATPASSNTTPATISGTFPLQGSSFTVTTVSDPPLSSITITSSSIPTSLAVGSTGNIIGSWDFLVSSDFVTLRGITFHLVGSANPATLQNVRLLVNGLEVGPTLPAIGSNDTAVFDLSQRLALLNPGTNSVEVLADVSGSPGLNLQLEILNSYDIDALDTQYNVPIKAQTNTGTQITIGQGSLALGRSSNSPTGSITAGEFGVTLARFIITASNEPLQLRFLGFNLTFTGASASLGISSQVQDLALVDELGNPVGSPISFPPSGNTCDAPISGSIVSGYTPASGVYTDCFGTSDSPINYTIQANTTHILSLVANIPTTANFSSVTAALTGNTDNIQGSNSGQLSSSPTISGNPLTLVL